MTYLGPEDGEEKEVSFILGQYLGKKTIIINFFATWCTSCIQEIPELRALQEKYQDRKTDLVFVAINAGERVKLIEKFKKKFSFPYRILLDPDRKATKSFGVEDLPKTIVISAKGKVVFRGDRPPKTLPL